MLLSQIHKRVEFNFEKQKLVFDTSRLLFSFAKIDDGTKALLNSLRKNKNIKYEKILDLGCGYGAIGVFLKKSFPSSEVLCTDRDSLAVEFTQHNAELNNVKIEASPSLDFEALLGHPIGKNINKKFSLIVTNFPAKLEKNGLKYFIEKSSEFLEKDGTLAIVVVKELEKDADEILSQGDPSVEGKNEKIIVQFKDKTNGYSVYHLRFKEELNPKSGPIELAEGMFIYPFGGNIILTTKALQEFDTPHFITDLIVELLGKLDYNSVEIINPNQGHIALAATHKKSLDKTVLISRDLLQLKITSENLRLNAINRVEAINSDMADVKTDLLIWSIHDEDAREICDKLEIFRKNHKNIILGARLQIINRVLEKLKIEPKKEIKGKYCVVEI
jgi:16S rRNA (guanine1207-N2)-methyltransferase